MTACQFCQDTGRSPGSDSLDCTRCGAAAERAEFERWFAAMPDDTWYSPVDAAWSIHQRGKAAAAPAWQPIETAPKEGVVWAFNGLQGVMQWTEGDSWAFWAWTDDILSDFDPNPDQPTHWMPIPPPPEGEKE